MPNQACDRLQQNIDRIMVLWEQRSRQEVAASTQQNSLVLQDALPEYLNLLADKLSTTIERTPDRVASDKATCTRISHQHGQERAGSADYSLEQLISEYHILRQVIFQVLESDSPLSVRDRDIIIGSVEQAVNDAASQFSATLRDIQEIFMGTLTHDLRGPITTVKVGSQLILLRHDRGDSPVAVVSTMLNAVSRMDSMIENLLDVSRLRAGHALNLQMSRCQLTMLIHEIAADLSFIYGEYFVVDADADISCNCSPKELRRVIENLAINAVKYGACDKPITLSIQQTEDQVTISVHNHGNPIPPAAQSILFQQFRRTADAQEKTGWGLGLFLAKSLTEAHHGTVSVESSESMGTRFIVTLPKGC